MSDLFKLDWRDLIKGAVVSVLTSVLAFILDALNKGVDLDLKTIGTLALSAFIGYLLKNLGTDSSGKLGGKI